MKKLSLKNLKLTSQDLLQRDQLKAVFGGYSCSVFVHTANGSYWSAQTYSVEYAQEAYSTGGDSLWGGHGNAGYSVTGYCCAHCHEYQHHPSWDGLFPVR
jgi:hypothetical protein